MSAIADLEEGVRSCRLWRTQHALKWTAGPRCLTRLPPLPRRIRRRIQAAFSVRAAAASAETPGAFLVPAVWVLACYAHTVRRGWRGMGPILALPLLLCSWGKVRPAILGPSEPSLSLSTAALERLGTGMWHTFFFLLILAGGNAVLPCSTRQMSSASTWTKRWVGKGKDEVTTSGLLKFWAWDPVVFFRPCQPKQWGRHYLSFNLIWLPLAWQSEWKRGWEYKGNYFNFLKHFIYTFCKNKGTIHTIRYWHHSVLKSLRITWYSFIQ